MLPGETCLKLAAAGNPNAFFNSLTRGYELRQSSRLTNPGDPLSNLIGSFPSLTKAAAGFWCGLRPYRKLSCCRPSPAYFLRKKSAIALS